VSGLPEDMEAATARIRAELPRATEAALRAQWGDLASVASDTWAARVDRLDRCARDLDAALDGWRVPSGR